MPHPCPRLPSASLMLLVAFGGCSTWSEATLSELPLPRMPRDSVVLETTFVRVPPDVDLAGMWNLIDEQHLTVETRQDLAANGLRSGVIGLQFPGELRDLLDQRTASDAEAIASGNVAAMQQQLQSRAGERSVLVVVPKLPDESVVLLSEAGRVSAKRRVTAKKFTSGQALVALKTEPLGDGTVELELTPEIKHGDVRHQWVPGSGSFRHDFSRAQFVFEQLRMQTVLSPGQTLLVTSTPKPKGLGALFFASAAELQSERLILLIRLAQTQYDDLFDEAETLEPLATPFE